MLKTVWKRHLFSLVLITSVALLVWIPRASAQTFVSGYWTASVSKDGSQIYVIFERHTRIGQHDQIYEFSDFQGLSREQAMSNGVLSFSLIREAGRIDCEGIFENGQGWGTFRFTANRAFVSAMKSRGFDFEADSNNDEGAREYRQFVATFLNVTTALADDLASEGIGKLRIEDLYTARIFKIDVEYIRKARVEGVRIDLGSLVQRKIGVARR